MYVPGILTVYNAVFCIYGFCMIATVKSDLFISLNSIN
jgi:hypothetical protein